LKGTASSVLHECFPVRASDSRLWYYFLGIIKFEEQATRDLEIHVSLQTGHNKESLPLAFHAGTEGE
jgi:hypothetical protein